MYFIRGLPEVFEEIRTTTNVDFGFVKCIHGQRHCTNAGKFTFSSFPYIHLRSSIGHKECKHVIVQFAQILIDNKKRNYKDLCYNWIIYGQLCPGECVFRHHLNESDIPRNRYPSGTEIRYRINHIYSPVHLQISEVDDVERAPKKTLRLIIGGLVPIDEPERYILFRRHLFRNHNLGSIFKSIVRLHLNGVILVDDVIAVDTATSSASMPLSEILSRADFVEANFDGISTLIQELSK